MRRRLARRVFWDGGWQVAIACVAIALCVAGNSVFADDYPATAPAKTQLTTEIPTLPALQQVIKRFDFDDTDAAPNSLPVPFFRYIAPSQGFPPFGAMRLTTEVSHSGAGSLEFELGGGSMSARIPTAVIPILPLTDYVVSVQVRTEGLHHARARLAAWLHDKTGQPIHSSRAQSRLVETAGGWEKLTVEVHGSEADAADLVLELQVVQPAQFTTLATDPDQPRLEDITGRVWFDEIVVSHLPRITLTMSQGRNFLMMPSVPELQIAINELTTESLTARLRVLNIDGIAAYDATFPAPHGRRSATVRIPLKSCGWYRAVLDVEDAGHHQRRTSLDFAMLPSHDRTEFGAEAIGVALNESAIDDPQTAETLRDVRCGAVVAPVWSKTTGAPQDHLRQISLRRLIEELLHREISVTFALEKIPDALAQSAAVTSNQVLELLAKDSHLWQPYLDDLLVNFGLEVNRWQVGSMNDPDALWSNQLGDFTAKARRSFADFVPGPRIFSPWSMQRADSPGVPLSGYAIAIPYQIAPEALEEYAAPFVADQRESFGKLEPLPAMEFSPRQRATDLLIRALYAWRAGLSPIFIDAPWRFESNSVQPDPGFVVWRSLATQLRGRSFVRELSTPPGMHCWILSGSSASDAAIVAWSDSFTNRDPRAFQSQLAAGPVTVTDAFGNSARIDPVNGVHTIQLSSMPVFIEQANLNLVQFRSSVALDPHFVPAVAKVHEAQIVIHNPWDVAISGSIRLTEDDDWKLSPSVQDFAIHPGGEIKLPLTIVPQRSILAGRKRIPAQITLNADQPYAINLQLDAELGLQNIEMVATWSAVLNERTGRHDLLVTEAVTNHGEKPVRLDVYLLADGVGQNRRMISALGAGETAVRTFRIADGATILAGQQVRVGVAEHDGLTRLNKLLTIGERGEANGRAIATGSLDGMRD